MSGNSACLLRLDDGLELWQVSLDELREQDKNARAMDPSAFERLQQTVGRDNRLESLPFCALTGRGIEIVSGHHRTRAARSAGIERIYAIVDTTGLTPSQIKAKQLAHNSIQGRDDPQLVKEIYEAIEDTDAMLEAYIDPRDLDLDLETLSVGNVSVDFEHRTIAIIFLPSEHDRFMRASEEVLRRLGKDVQTVLLAETEKVELFQRLANGVSEAIQVKAYGAILGATADIVLDVLGVDDDDKTERVHLAQVLRQAYIPREAADVIARALDRLERDHDLGPKNRWQGIEYLAADYLAGNGDDNAHP